MNCWSHIFPETSLKSDRLIFFYSIRYTVRDISRRKIISKHSETRKQIQSNPLFHQQDTDPHKLNTKQRHGSPLIDCQYPLHSSRGMLLDGSYSKACSAHLVRRASLVLTLFSLALLLRPEPRALRVPSTHSTALTYTFST